MAQSVKLVDLMLALVATCLLVPAASAWWFMADNNQQQPAAASPNAAAASYQQANNFSERVAMATFDMDGVRGTFKFSQIGGQNATTNVEYDLQGLKGNNRLYHVHIKPVPPFDANKVRNNASAIAQLCGDPQTGGHLNPHHITAKLPPQSAPFDKYEIGDLSGKHGSLKQLEPKDTDRYVGSFKDDKLPLQGEHSILGRSLVIHKNDTKRWVCASIVEAK